MPVVMFTPKPSLAQALEFYISKAAMDCVVANEATYIAKKTYDFAIVFPAVCPAVPDNADITVGNEYLRLPDSAGKTPTEAEAIIVPINRFACLRRLAAQTEDVATTDLLLIDLETCSVTE